MALDLVGQRFGRLVVVELVERTRKTSHWACKCDCGVLHLVARQNLKSGSVTSCGCLARELSSKRMKTHGASTKRTPEYVSWCQMIARCEDPKATGYERYGGVGITVSPRWRHDFSAFLADMGPRPKGTSLDRFPNRHGNYEPGNCRWATASEQNYNRSFSEETKAAMRARARRLPRKRAA